MIRKISFFFLISCLYLSVGAQTPQPIKQFLRKPYMEGASFSLIVKEVNSGETVFAYDTIRQLTPASVMKTVTTATALEILGEDYRFPTTLEYDGSIENGLLKGISREAEIPALAQRILPRIISGFYRNGSPP